MSKDVFLAEIETKYLSGEPSQPQKYWDEAKSLNELFKLFEENDFLHADLYLNLRPVIVETWGELLKVVELSVEVKEFDSEKIPGNAGFDHDAWFSALSEFLISGKQEISFAEIMFPYIYKKHEFALNRSVSPIRDLLIALEDIIGNECFNMNKSEPWERYGMLSPPGPRYRYPLSIGPDSDLKVRSITPDINNCYLMSGRYTFGANQLDIFRGLYKALIYLQDNGYLKENLKIR
jgi:hypothetical protein